MEHDATVDVAVMGAGMADALALYYLARTEVEAAVWESAIQAWEVQRQAPHCCTIETDPAEVAAIHMDPDSVRLAVNTGRIVRAAHLVIARVYDYIPKRVWFSVCFTLEVIDVVWACD